MGKAKNAVFSWRIYSPYKQTTQSHTLYRHSQHLGLHCMYESEICKWHCGFDSGNSILSFWFVHLIKSLPLCCCWH